MITFVITLLFFVLSIDLALLSTTELYSSTTQKSEYKNVEEQLYYPVILLSLTDTILKQETAAQNFIAQIEEIGDQEHITGVILHVHAWGGAISLLEPLQTALITCARKKPLVVFIDQACTSAAYMLVAPFTLVSTPLAHLIGIGFLHVTQHVSVLYNMSAHCFSSASDTTLSPSSTAHFFCTNQQRDVPTITLFESEFTKIIESLQIQRPGLSNKELIQGQPLLAARAYQHGLVDHLGSLTTAVTVLLTSINADRTQKNLSPLTQDNLLLISK